MGTGVDVAELVRDRSSIRPTVNDPGSTYLAQPLSAWGNGQDEFLS